MKATYLIIFATALVSSMPVQSPPAPKGIRNHQPFTKLAKGIRSAVGVKAPTGGKPENPCPGDAEVCINFLKEMKAMLPIRSPKKAPAKAPLKAPSNDFGRAEPKPVRGGVGKKAMAMASNAVKSIKDLVYKKTHIKI
ncbi:hypothetical protein DSO57_1024306 [Entomophthora muscae]|uniref:Uncharacterized protein n=1 Tax=Entomophthora muscae TaxID=34485 RepID=A0ACC2T2I6_9FUNG|nr:hypothetical protein DSO57_1024306 [Entomophthora muscae]